jgi:hypothetical protein
MLLLCFLGTEVPRRRQRPPSASTHPISVLPCGRQLAYVCLRTVNSRLRIHRLSQWSSTRTIPRSRGTKAISFRIRALPKLERGYTVDSVDSKFRRRTLVHARSFEDWFESKARRESSSADVRLRHVNRHGHILHVRNQRLQ